MRCGLNIKQLFASPIYTVGHDVCTHTQCSSSYVLRAILHSTFYILHSPRGKLSKKDKSASRTSLLFPAYISIGIYAGVFWGQRRRALFCPLFSFCLRKPRAARLRRALRGERAHLPLGSCGRKKEARLNFPPKRSKLPKKVEAQKN